MNPSSRTSEDSGILLYAALFPGPLVYQFVTRAQDDSISDLYQPARCWSILETSRLACFVTGVQTATALPRDPLQRNHRFTVTASTGRLTALQVNSQVFHRVGKSPGRPTAATELQDSWEETGVAELGRKRQEDQEFEASLGYMSPCSEKKKRRISFSSFMTLRLLTCSSPSRANCFYLPAFLGM